MAIWTMISLFIMIIKSFIYTVKHESIGSEFLTQFLPSSVVNWTVNNDTFLEGHLGPVEACDFIAAHGSDKTFVTLMQSSILHTGPGRLEGERLVKPNEMTPFH